MKFLKVKLWDKEIGRLVWDANTRRTYFMYNPDNSADIPDVSPLLSPAATRNVLVPIFGDEHPIYQGLPPFIADSLPDSWGNTLFDRWVKDSKVPRNKVTPLYKLMFIGSRGMGALEYEPYASDLVHSRSVDIKSLYEMSLKVLEERETVALNESEEPTMQTLLAVGTSAGGRQMKGIIAINDKTGEIRSGQSEGLEGFEYYILKFGDKAMPTAEIEAAYHRMASLAGVEMEECRLFRAAGINHFLTKRFDRKNGKKLHMQTLAAINPEARSYEDLVATCRELSIPESQIEQLFARLAFNVMANNTDDHNKNFSFLLEEGGRWHQSPAYDMTFTFNVTGTGPNIERRLSVGGKTSDITKTDLLDFARNNDIKGANATINRVASAIKHFDEFADACGIPQPWRGIVQKTLNDNLSSFGNLESRAPECAICSDKYGRTISHVTISINAKGHYEVTAIINGQRQRRFVKPNTALHSILSQRDPINGGTEDKIKVVEAVFAPE